MPKPPAENDAPKTQPKPLPAKHKPSHGGPTTKAEHAAAKRIDKMVIKRMRKR